MEKFQTYALLEKISDTPWAQVFRSQHSEKPDTKVLVTIFKHRSFSVSGLARIRKEYNVIKKIDHPGIIRPVDVISHNGQLAVITEDIPCPSLESVLKLRSLELKDGLQIARELSEILSAIHQSDVIHGAISPFHIYIDPETLNIKVSDFGIVSAHISKENSVFSEDVIRRALTYASPEQTGRMNRWVDYRTDFYSMGIVLYEIFTGQPPFFSKDPMDMIYSHIAIAPEPPDQLNPKLPPMVSRIIEKLLNKNGEERYQNALGIFSDLDECLRQLKEKGRISEFEPGKKDVPRRFNMPQKVYGRQKEVAQLLGAFKKACSGRRQIVMVRGLPGMGKSALVNEIHKPVVAGRAFFVSGKYEQYRKDTPYSAIIQAFKNLVRQILSQNDEQISEWKKLLNNALKPNGQVIADIISDVELIMGKQPPVPTLGPEETRNRFLIVFERFVQVFARSEHPLVLFLDDLQWADTASLEMLGIMSRSHDISHFLMIGAFRSDEMDPEHLLSHKIEQIRTSGANLDMINIGPLAPAHVTELIQANMKASGEQCRLLADLVLKKTGGTPFFVNQFIKTLYDEGLIWMKTGAQWEWDIQKIENLQVTDNLVKLLVEKITKLQPKTRDTLKVCACIGNRFNPEMIAFLENKSVEDILDSLEEAIHEGLIRGSGSHYCYHHDRIHEAAYSLLNNNEKGFIHYRLGKKILVDYSDRPLNGKLFYVADQLNAGIKWIKTDKEKLQLACFDFKAGRKAKASAAYDTALEYYRLGLELLGPECWDSAYGMTLDAYAQMTEIYYLTGDTGQMQLFLETGKSKARSAIDKSWFYAIQIKAYTTNKQHEKAVETGLEILEQLGVHLPAVIDDAAMLVSLQDIMGQLDGKTDDELLDLPYMKNPEFIFASRIIHEMASASYTVGKNMSSVLWLEMIRIYLKYGKHPVGASAFVSYGVIMIIGLGDISSGVRFGKLAFKILEKIRNKNFLAAVSSTYNLMIRHWVDPVSESVRAGLDVNRLALETGDIEYAAMGLFLHDTYSIAKGVPLEQLEKTMIRHHRMIVKFNQHHIANYHSLWMQLVLNQRGKTTRPLKITLDGLDEKSLEEKYLKTGDYACLCIFYQIKFFLFFMYEEFEQALAYLEKAEAYQDHLRGLVSSHHLVYMGAVTRLAVWPSRSETEQKALMAVVDAKLMQIEHWRGFSPANFEYRCKMIQAIKSHLSGDEMTALKIYDETLELCHENGMEFESLTINSMAVVFFLRSGRTRLAHTYLQDAYQNHVAAGRVALIKYYRAKYPFIKSQHSGIETDDKRTDPSSVSRMLDMDSVLKASQAMSGEIVLHRLLKRMMQIVLENAGAQNGCMILNDDGALLVEAEYAGDGQKSIVLQETPVDQHGKLSKALVHYVARKKETVILDHASETGDFIQDLYFKKNESKSVLCHPVMSQGRLLGILYLENNLATGAFTSKHLEVLKIIASQAAISIENARLYANLEQKVQERTRELENAYEKIKHLANTDPLTQLSNRRDMMEKIKAETHRMARSKDVAALVLSDIDDFKAINDTYGHDCGDFVLKTLAETMTSMIRNQDIVARWGGEEFLFFLPQTDRNGAKTIAEKIRKKICETALMFGGHELSVSMTFGVSDFTDPAVDIDLVLKQADDALYEGKKTGKNRVILPG